jgi:hypothetical protein
MAYCVWPQVHYLIHCLVSAGIMPVCALGEDLVDLLTGTETKIAVWALSKMLMVSGEVYVGTRRLVRKG